MLIMNPTCVLKLFINLHWHVLF